MLPARLHQRFGTLCLLLLLMLPACRSAATVTPTPTVDGSSAPAQQSTNQPANQPASQPTPQAVDQPAILAPSRPESAQPEPGGTAILGLVGQPDSLNPIVENDPALRELAPLLFGSLLRVDPHTARLQPGLAHRWAYSDDGRQVRFELPSDLKWSDGTPLTAADLARSLQATEHPALRAFSDIRAPEADTLRLTFATIDCAAVTTLALLPLLPSAQIMATVPAGSGPFRVESRSEDRRTLTLARNPNYHSEPPFLEGITIRFIQDDEVQLAHSEGQFDLIGPLHAPISHYPPSVTTASSPFSRVTYPAPQVIYQAINFDPKNDPPLAPAVRQALPLALDREAILAEALAGDGQLAAGSLLPGHWAAVDDLSPPEYDPERARTLLTRAGLRDVDGDGWLDQNGDRLELSVRVNGQNRLHQELGWLISGYYRELGLFARAEGVPFESLVDDLFTHDFRLALYSWLVLPDPDQRLYWRSTEDTEGLGLNVTSYRNTELDDRLDQAVAVPGCEPQERAEIYADIQQTLADDGPVDFLLVPNRHLLVGSRLRGVEPGPFAPFTWNGADWTVPHE